MNKIEKFLRKLNEKEQEVFLLLMMQLKTDYKKVPNLIKLKGFKDLFRIRVGRYRIIFEVTPAKVEIRKITKRDERTYQDL